MGDCALPSWLGRTDAGWSLRIHAQPGAARTEVMGLHGEALKVRIAAPPVEGKANAELVAHLATALQLPKTKVSVRRGTSGRAKQVEVATDLEAGQMIARLTGKP